MEKQIYKPNVFFYWENGIVHIAKCLALGKTLYVYIDYLMFYTSRQHVRESTSSASLHSTMIL